MAALEASNENKSSKKSKKRKQITYGETERPLKATRPDSSEEKVEAVRANGRSERKDQFEEEGEVKFKPPWKKLELVLFIQNRQFDPQRKIKLAYDFVRSITDEGDGTGQDFEVLKLPRFLNILNDWIQSLLISSSKKSMDDGKNPQIDGTQMYMDFRCWEIFKFCLEESKKLHVSLSISRNFLQPINSIATSALSLLEDASVFLGESALVDKRLELYRVVLDCVCWVFSYHGGLSNENLDSWMSTTSVVLELAQKSLTMNLENPKVRDFSLHILLLVLEPFSKFLKVHPGRKDGFNDFVEKLLEPLLHLSDNLQNKISEGCTDFERKSLSAVEEILSQGLFHQSHIDGFLGLHSSEKYIEVSDGKKDSKTVIKSYHRHLFDTLEQIIVQKKIKALYSLGFLFQLLVDQVRKLRGASLLTEGTKVINKAGDSMKSEDHSSGPIFNVVSDSGFGLPRESSCSLNLSTDSRKSLFNFFVHIMEPLLVNVDSFVQDDVENRTLLLDGHSTLKSISNLLHSFMHEKVYVRTEDTFGGACLNFLNKIYDAMISFSTKLVCSSKYDKSDRTEREILTLLANETLVVIGYLLEIEYEVLGDDLVNLWLMMLLYLSINCSLMDVLGQPSLFSTIVDLGCKAVSIYSELRQVKSSIFALCKAMRLLVSYDDNAAKCSLGSLTSFSNKACWDSVERLLTSEKLVHTINEAIKSIPEGQVSGCILQLTDDISESLNWLKKNSLLADSDRSHDPNMRSVLQVFDRYMDLLGRGLCKLYVLLLDSLTVTEGNCNPVGVAMKKLMSIMRPCMSSLVGLEPLNINRFLLSVIGKTFDNGLARKVNEPMEFRISTQWVFVFFFQLFISYRSLIRQVISLMPPNSSKKISEEMGDFLTAYSAWHLIERNDIDRINVGYFSAFIQPSTSLLVVMQSVSNIYLQKGTTDCCPLVYVFHAMALQRIVDLNRQIILLKYLKNNLSLMNTLKEEAKGLAMFIVQHLQLVYEYQIYVTNNVTYDDTSAQDLRESDGCHFKVSLANNKSLPVTIWSNLCNTIDIWGNYAPKKPLKKFMSFLLSNSLCNVASSTVDNTDHKISDYNQMKGVNLHAISLELLCNSVLYEQQSVRRNLASRFCHILDESVSQVFTGISCTDVNIRALPNWPEVLSDLDSFLVMEPKSQSSDTPPAEISNEEKASPLTSKGFAICHNLLDFLCWTPFIDAKSFSCYLTCILNIERLLVDALSYPQGTLCQDSFFELLKLFVSCRKAFRYIIMALVQKAEDEGFLLYPILSESQFHLSWLFKSISVILGLKEALLKHNATHVKDLILSLMDHTSYVFLGMGKYQFICIMRFPTEVENPCEDPSNCMIANEENYSVQYDEKSSSSECAEAWSNFSFILEMLKGQMQCLLISQNGASSDGLVRFQITDENINRYSALVSCFSGFLWGLASVMSCSDTKGSDDKAKVLKWKPAHVSLNNCMYGLVEFFYFFLCTLLVDNNQQSRSLSTIQNNLKRTESEKACSSESLLCGLLKGYHPAEAFLLRQVLMASSAILRLTSHKNGTPLLSALIPVLNEISQVLLLEFVEMFEVPWQSFIVLDGVLSYLRELANHFPMTESASCRKLYAGLIDLHLRTMGKIISLQGKRATLASHKIQSSTKMLRIESAEAQSSYGMHTLDEFKVMLRKSFEAYVERPSEVHLLSAIQAIERALVVGKERCISVHEIEKCVDGGKVSSTVAAGIECLDLLLESVSGRKGLSLIKGHIRSLVAGVFNIILHLQSLQIFCHMKAASASPRIVADPDPGSVILMCVEVLVRVSRRHASFQIDAWHVGYCLHIPATLFQNFHQLKNQVSPFVAAESVYNVDGQFSVDLFASCCQLLCANLKHQKRECKQCFGLLEASLSALLNCLEAADNASLIKKGYFSWKLEEGVKCACFLRRVYEEIRQQKDIFGKHYCCLLLSNYIRVYSGFGPLKSGIKRDMDEALRPGIYALIDACSRDGLQYVHTVFGEGPCRNTLAALQHDYNLNFKYEGKV